MVLFFRCLRGSQTSESDSEQQTITYLAEFHEYMNAIYFFMYISSAE